MDNEEKVFIGLLAKADLTGEKFVKRELARTAGLNSMRMELDGLVMGPDGKQMPLRDSIRAGMTFQVVDKDGKKHEASFSDDGQEHAVDTHGAVKKGRGLSEEDQPRVQKAMEDALKLVEKLRAQKGPDGEPLYDESDMMEEVFTPLMREGLLPDNFILDRYSATNELLAATFGRYKQALKDAEKAKATKRDQDTVDLGGANGKLGQLKAIGGKAMAVKDKMQKQMMSKLHLSEDAQRRIALGKGIVSDVKSFISSNEADLKSVIPESLQNDVKGFLDPIESHLKTAQDNLNSDIAKHSPFLANGLVAVEEKVEGITITGPVTSSSSNDAPKPSEFKKLVAEIQASKAMEVFDHFAAQVKDKFEGAEDKLETFLDEAGEKLGALAEKINVVLEQIPPYAELEGWAKDHSDEFKKMCLDGLKGLKTPGETAVTGIIDFKAMSDEMGAIDHEREVESAIRDAIQQIDAVLSEVVGKVDGVAGVALSGQFVTQTKAEDVVTAAKEKPADGKGIVTALAAGIEDTFTNAAPDSDDDSDDTGAVFEKMGKAVAAAFKGKANADQLSTKLAENPVAAMGVVIAAARSAAAKEMGTLGGTDKPEDSGTVAAFSKKVKDPAKQKALLAKGALPDAEAMQEEMEENEKELQSYEDSLMMIDDGGMDAAEAKKIETLIHDLKQNRKTLELVAGLGQGLLSAGVSALKPIIDTGLGGPATDVLKLAKMIATLAVNVKKAADRWQLWYKFRSSLEHSKKAVSALTSTIQGFFNNKKEQIAFHTIDDALQAVQIAFTIVGMVPEPITMGVGKSVTLIAAGAQKANSIAGKVYNEAMLTKAWNTTVAAMNNPGDRSLGLAALRLNPTLGMHAVAWAGAERKPADPIARMLMNRLGIDAQTIAAGISGDSVKDYLVELLNEDRQIERSDGINLDWLPPKYGLSARDFFTITQRASQKATPKLRLAGEKAVIDALKALDTHDLPKLAPFAAKGDVEPDQLTKLVDEAKAAHQALLTYKPVAEDNSLHAEMADVQTDLLGLAGAQVTKLEAMEETNNLVRTQALDALALEIEKIGMIPDDAKSQAIFDQMDSSNRVLRDISSRSVFAQSKEAKRLTMRLSSEIEMLRERIK